MVSSHHDEERIPERTTPQGTQEEGVERGHEGTDITFRGLATWFIVLAVVAVITDVGVWAVLQAWSGREERRDVLPSTVMEVQPPPPLPRVLPNPVDSPLGREEPVMGPAGAAPGPAPPPAPAWVGREEPMMGPAEALEKMRQQEDERLRKLGLEDRDTRQPALPPDAVAAVTRQSGSTGGVGLPQSDVPGPRPGAGSPAPEPASPLDQWMPSESSGGRQTENWTVPDDAYRRARAHRSGG